MPSPVDEIKDRLDIVDVIQSYVRLKKAGASHKALCPFHTEKTPSFSVSQEKQMWYCFGCGEGGDIFTFVEKIENVEFADALRIMADRAGVQFKKEDPRLRSERKGLYEVLELATNFFEKQLESKRGQMVVSYLKKRGLKPKTIKDWRLGYAPDKWQGLYDFLVSKGYSDKTIEASGLALKSEKGPQRYHDRFRHRIMFPVLDVQGQVVGFSARVFDKVEGKTVGEGAGKYINTPSTLIYDKSRALYGLDKAKNAIREKDQFILLEGNLDVMLSHQAGNQNAVAVSGTAFNDTHLRMIKRYTNNLFFGFDSDDAGIKATQRAANLALSYGFNVSILLLPKDMDAADVIEKDESIWQKIVASPVHFVKFSLDRALKTFSLTTIEDKKKVAREVLSVIKNLTSPVEKEHWIGELGIAVSTSEQSLYEEMRTINRGQTPENRGQTPEAKLSLEPEEYLLSLLLSYPDGKNHLKKNIDFINPSYIKDVFKKIIKGEDAYVLISADDKFKPVVIHSAFMGSFIEDKEAEFLAVLKRIRRKNIKGRLIIIEADLKNAEKKQDAKSVKTLLVKFNNLSQELLNYEKNKA